MAQNVLMSNAQPGWYPDPHARGRMRWWDGVRWHHATRTEAEVAQSRLDAAIPAAPDPTDAEHAGTPDASTQAIPLAPVLPSLMDAARELGADGPLGADGGQPGAGSEAGGPGGPGRRRRKAWWWGAGAAGVVVIVCAAVALPGHDGDPAAAPSPTPSFVTLDPSDREAATPSTTTTPSSSPSRQPSPTPSATPTPTTTPSPAPTRSAGPASTTAPSAPPAGTPKTPSRSPTSTSTHAPTPTSTPTPSPTPLEVAPSGTYDCPSSAPVKARKGTAYPADWWTYSVIRPEVCFASIGDAEADGYAPAGH